MKIATVSCGDTHQYVNEKRSGASVKTARENGEKRYGRQRLARALHTRGSRLGASRLPKTSKNDCFAVYPPGHLSSIFTCLRAGFTC